MLKITITGPTKAERKQKKRSLKKLLLGTMQQWINELLEADRDEFLGRERQVRLDEQHDNDRNGYRPRSINFFGLGKRQLRIPRDRRGQFQSAWLRERKAQDPEFEAVLAEAFLAGLSTRDLARITEKH
jgi:transposase-like protein